MLRWHGKYPLETFQVPSKSKKNKFWEVSLWGDGLMTCECPVNTMRKRTCKHIQAKEQELIAIFESIKGAVNHYRELKKQ